MLGNFQMYRLVFLETAKHALFSIPSHIFCSNNKHDGIWGPCLEKKELIYWWFVSPFFILKHYNGSILTAGGTIHLYKLFGMTVGTG